MKYCSILFLSLFFINIVWAQPHAKHSCHYYKSTADAAPMTEEDKAWVQSSLLRSDTFDITHYDITVNTLRFDEEILIGRTTVEFTALQDDLTELRLDLEGLEVSQVEGALGHSLSFNQIGVRTLSIQLDTVLSTGDSYHVTVDYSGEPITFSFGGFYFEDGYAYNLGIGIQASPHNMGRAWYPCFDNFIERATYSFRIIAHEGRKGYGLGDLVLDSLQGDTSIREFEMLYPIPTYLSHVAVSNYEEVNYTHRGEFGDVPVRLISKPEDTANLRRSFEVLGDALDCMEFWYGPYPFNFIGYNIVTRGAMEHPTGVAYPISSIENGSSNEGLIMHELAHHWWGDVTTLDSEFDMWLKEGPASYAEQQYEGWVNGEQAFIDAVRANNTRMLRVAHRNDGDFLPLSPMPDEYTYGTHTYDKGAAMIHNLYSYLGDSLFRVAMQAVLQKRYFESIDAATFRDDLEEASSIELDDFFDNWIFSPGWSDFYIQDQSFENDTLYFDIGQNLYGTDDYHTNVPITIVMVDEQDQLHYEKINCSRAKTEVKLHLGFEPKMIYLNPHQSLNLASIGDMIQIDSTGDYSIANTNWNFEVETEDEAVVVGITDHLASPDDTLISQSMRLSSRHFWTVQIANHPTQMSTRIRYEGGVESQTDFDLVGNSEDSIGLVYRPNIHEAWRPYPNQDIRIGFPRDGRGSIVIDTLMSGHYALANFVLKPSSTRFENIEDIEIYPNPFSNKLNFNQLVSGTKVKLYNTNGQLVLQLENLDSNHLNTEGLKPGKYVIELELQNGEVYTHKLIKQ